MKPQYHVLRVDNLVMSVQDLVELEFPPQPRIVSDGIKHPSHPARSGFFSSLKARFISDALPNTSVAFTQLLLFHQVFVIGSRVSSPPILTEHISLSITPDKHCSRAQAR